MGLLAGIIGVGQKLVGGVKTLINNAKIGKAATSAGFVPGLVPADQQNIAGKNTIGGLSMNMILAIAGLILFGFILLFSLFSRKR